MTIDEAIAQEREKAKKIRENIIDGDNLEPYESYCNTMVAKSAEKYEQIAEWLEELKSYRASVFSGYMTQKMLKEEYNKAIDDYTEKAKAECKVHYVDCDPYFGGIEDSILYEDDIDEIAEQLKEGGENEN